MVYQKISELEKKRHKKNLETKKLEAICKIRDYSDSNNCALLRELDDVDEKLKSFLEKYNNGEYEPEDKEVLLRYLLNVYDSYTLYLFIYILHYNIKTIINISSSGINANNDVSRKKGLDDLKEAEDNYLKTLTIIEFLNRGELVNVIPNNLIAAIKNNSLDEKDMNDVYTFYFRLTKALLKEYSLTTIIEIIIKRGVIDDRLKKRIKESFEELNILLDTLSSYLPELWEAVMRRIFVFKKEIKFLEVITSKKQPNQ